MDVIYKKRMNVSCINCKHPFLYIWAFAWVEDGITKSTPVLVCPSRGGCGCFFDPDEYGLNDFHLIQ